MRVAWIILLIILSMHAVARCQTPATTQSTQPASDAATVKRGTVRPHIDIAGYFEPIDPLEVRFRPEAYVGDLEVIAVAPHAGSVKKGDVILSIDPDPINRQISAANVDLANADAALAKAKADVELGERADQIALKSQQNDLDNAKGALKWFDDVEGKQLITTAEMGTRTAKAAVEDQADELDQLKKMYKTEELTNATADIVVKRALRNLDLNKISAGMAEEHEQKVKQFDYERERVKLLGAIDQQANALAQLNATQAQSAVTRKTALETATASLERARKKADDLKTDLAAFTVKAPFDGIVYYGELESGAWQNSGPKALRVDDKIGVNQVVMTLFAPGKMRVAAEIDEPRIGWLRAGDQARIVPAANPQAITHGACAAIIPAAGKDNAFVLPFDLEKIDPKKQNPALMPGEKASVQIDLPEVKDVLVVPNDAVQHGRVKIKAGDNGAEWREVVTGFWDEKNTEIKSGLSEGETLAPDK